MCHNAHLNGYIKAKKVVGNCNIPPEILSSGLYEEDFFNKQTRFGAAEFSPYNRSLISYVNKSSVNTIYIMTIRNPIDRIVSDINFGFCENNNHDSRSEPCLIARHNKSFHDIIENDSCLKNSSDTQHSKGHSTSMLDSIYGNFYIRTLTGCRQNCSEIHLHLAKKFLDLLSFVIISDTEESYERFNIIKHKYTFFLLVI